MQNLKEWLNTKTFEYKQAHTKPDGEWVCIPEGADKYVYFNEYDNANFYKGDFDAVWQDDGYWDHDMDDYKSYCKKFSVVLWQRATHPEELPFIDDEPKYTDDEVKYMDESGQGRLQSINDQYAEIEEVRQQTIESTLSQRQSQYGCYEDVAHVTQQILSALRIGNYDKLPAPMKESLHMIASKMARIVNGDPEYLDNWHDIGGYSKLIEKLIKGE